MTVTITQNVRDITGVSDTSSWRFSSVLREGSDENSIVTSRIVTVTPVAGVLTVELDPGPAIVSIGDRVFSFTVPDTDSDLWSLIEVGLAVPADMSAQRLASAISAYLEANPMPVDITEQDKADIASDVEASLDPPLDFTILFANSLV